MRFRHWVLGGALVGIVYACGGSPETSDDNDFGPGNSGGSASGGDGQGASSNGGTLNVGNNGSGASSASGGDDGAGANGSAGDNGGILDAGYPDDVTFEYDASGTGQQDACAAVVGEATLVKKPMDIIISIDNSGSMAGEIAAVQDRINTDFAQIIEDSGIDYRVIMVTRYGDIDNDIGSSNFPVCIGSPLGPDDCSDPDAEPVGWTVVNPPRFYHYSADIESTDMWCRLLAGYNSPDENGGTRVDGEPHYPWPVFAPNGYQDWLREEAFKVFIAISDDQIDCNPAGDPDFDDDPDNDDNDENGEGLAEAEEFDQVLRTLAPEHFGAYDALDPDANRNYRYYAIVGMVPRADPDQTVPWEPTDPIQEDVCTGPGGGDANGVAPGFGHQHLAILTGGLRYSNCLNDDFDAMFNAVAEGIVEGAQASCEYDVPIPDEGIVNLEETEVEYEPGGGGNAVALPQVDDETACGSGDGFYFSAGGEKLFLCPTTCSTVQADADATVNIDFGCLGS